MSKPHTPKQPYPAQFRQQMIELVRAGRKPSELAKEFVCHATGIAFGNRCKEMGVGPSMGTVGDAYDNAMAREFLCQPGV